VEVEADHASGAGAAVRDARRPRDEHHVDLAGLQQRTDLGRQQVGGGGHGGGIAGHVVQRAKLATAQLAAGCAVETERAAEGRVTLQAGERREQRREGGVLAGGHAARAPLKPRLQLIELLGLPDEPDPHGARP
jgi:hypothetical protein